MKTKERPILLISIIVNLALAAFITLSSSFEPEPSASSVIQPSDNLASPGEALPSSVIDPTETAAPTENPIPTDTLLPTVIDTPRASQPPTNTPLPTATYTTLPTATPTLTPSPTSTPTPIPIPQPEWLAYLNTFRQMVGLPDLANNAEWSEDSRLHSIYMVNSDDITHHPDHRNEWFTVRGELAGENGNIAATVWNEAAYNWAINYWMSAPFHGLPILDPELTTVGFGLHTAPYGEQDDFVNFAATLDVLRGLNHSESDPNSVEFPIIFPPDGGQTWILRHGLYEYPNPLDACPGYKRPVGPPIMIQTGLGDGQPIVTSYNFTENGHEMFACMIHEGNYTGSTLSATRSGTNILDVRDAVIVIPFHPLVVGNVYKLTITIDGETYSTEFTAVEPPYKTD